MPNGSNAATYTDANRPNGTYCYRMGAQNPVTGNFDFSFVRTGLLCLDAPTGARRVRCFVDGKRVL